VYPRAQQQEPGGEKDVKNMCADLTGKRVLVLSDHNELSSAIELNLSSFLGTEVVKLAPSPPDRRSPAGNGNFDLIVVAMSSSLSEAVVLLSQSSLVERIGQVPLLIISDRPFYADLDNQVFHLDFPFDIGDLLDRVRAILRGEPDPMWVDVHRARGKAASAQRWRRHVP